VGREQAVLEAAPVEFERLNEDRAAGWRERRAAGWLADLLAGGGAAHGLLEHERAAIPELFDG